jgi:hypothetical protein
VSEPVKVFHATFLQPTELPGKSMATHVNLFNPEASHRGGFDLALVELAGHQYLRISSPWADFAARGRGAWYESHDPKKQPLHGLARTCYVPRELLKKLELVQDMEADHERLAAERGPKKKTA